MPLKKTFIITVGIDSEYRLKNLDLITNYYKTFLNEEDTILIIESLPDESSESKIPFIAEKGLKYTKVVEKSYNLAKNRNYGIEIAINELGAEIICIVDCDALVYKTSFDAVLHELESGRYAWGYPFLENFRNIHRDPKSFALIDNGIINEEMPIESLQRFPTPSCSLFYMFNITKLPTIPKFCEDYCGWGPEDKDFYLTHFDKYGPPVRAKTDVFHINHPKNGTFYNKLKVDRAFALFKEKHGNLNDKRFSTCILLS